MVELAEARVMNRRMLQKLKRHHNHRHGQEDVIECGGLEGHQGGVVAGGPIVVVLRGKHHHHHHYHGGVPCGTASIFRDGEEEHGYDHHHHGKQHHRRGSLGPPVGHMVLEGLRGLKHHGRKHRHHRCRGLGCVHQHHGDGETPTAPPAELTPFSLSLFFKNLVAEEMKLRYPFLKFKGRIVYSRTAEEVDGAAMQLLKFVETKRREVGHVILGLDIEWRPSFRRGISPGKVAVMQICGDSHHCYVMHIFHSGVPHNLRILLEDPASTKVGVGIGNDSVKLFKDCSISTKDVQDLSKLANRKFGGKLKSWSLRSLIEELMHKQVEKSSAVQLGNWEATYLSELQLHYAALDAYASWSIHQVLDGLPDAPGDDNAKELNVSS
ncbi:unnamed protein product [Rhodiola kirilowii]